MKSSVRSLGLVRMIVLRDRRQRSPAAIPRLPRRASRAGDCRSIGTASSSEISSGAGYAITHLTSDKLSTGIDRRYYHP
jgi:hypothetical protein